MCANRVWYALVAVLVCASGVCAAPEVVVVRQRLTYEQHYPLTLNNTIEYILEFVPSDDEGRFPTRVWVSTDGGDTTRPVLITARQRAGAVTWQLPYSSGEELFYEFERTLCVDDGYADDNHFCPDEADMAIGGFSLHVGSSCGAPVRVTLRASVARDYRLAFESLTHVRVTQAAPRVYHYRFWENQEHVRLIVASDDDLCATISVQNYTCPIAETMADVSVSSLRMTVQRSGAMQIARSRYPHGFYVVALVHESDAACSGVSDSGDDWLWAAAVWDSDDAHLALQQPRTKDLTLTVQPALTRSQYAIAGAVTVLVFLAFYAAFVALVVVQRWPRLAKFCAPKAVLADTNNPENGPETEVDSGGRRRRRRDSVATFDSRDNSDTDEEPTPATTNTIATAAATATGIITITDGNMAVLHAPADTTDEPQNAQPDSGTQASPGPYGLPPRLRLAALSQHRARVLRARADRYLHTLYTVAVFYALPVVQFVAAFQILLNVSGSLDTCYYNFLCAHPAGALSDFNHVFSNLGYLLLGALFMLQVRRRRLRRKLQPRDEEYGIPAHYGLLSALGAGMMVVALLSASYHVCPNRLNFQFDTAFMYVLSVLSMVKIYQARHPDVNARAHATFGVLAVLIALVVWGVLGGGPLFWGLFTVLHLFTVLLISLRIYYVGQFRLEKESLAMAARSLRALPAHGVQPLYRARLVMLLLGNAANWLLALYGLFTLQADFAGHLLEVLLCNTLLYMLFYLTMKLLHGERPRWYAWAFLAGAAAAWAPALYFFVSGSSDWSATPAQSRHRNHECMVLRFYDAHDLWHMLSAVALYLSFNAMLTWDDGLAAVKRTEIAVF